MDYYWYAGEIVQKDGKTIMTPVEFGATNLVGADLMLQTQFGLVGALVIEPLGSTWADDTGSHAFSTVTKPDGQVVPRVRPGDAEHGQEPVAWTRRLRPARSIGRDAGFGAVNYRTENFAMREARRLASSAADLGFGNIFSNGLPSPA